MSAFGGKADIGRKHFNVRFGSKADITIAATMSAFGGKADIGRKHFNVRFGSKADIAELRYNPTADRRPARMGDEGKAVSSHVAGDLLCETYTIERMSVRRRGRHNFYPLGISSSPRMSVNSALDTRLRRNFFLASGCPLRALVSLVRRSTRQNRSVPRSAL
jgi:hypothetical protein